MIDLRFGIRKPDYDRHLAMGLAISTGVILFADGNSPNIITIVFSLLNWALYPYSRAFHERLVNRLFNGQIFLVRGWTLLMAKAFTISTCWFHAVIGAPLWFLFRRKLR